MAIMKESFIEAGCEVVTDRKFFPEVKMFEVRHEGGVS